MEQRNFEKAAEMRCRDPLCLDRNLATGSLNGAHISSDKDVSYLLPNALFPPDRRDLGRAAWTLLHTFASRFAPTNEAQKKEASEWMYAFSRLYPCKVCRPGVISAVNQSPPRVDSAEQFALWMCELRNTISRDIGAPLISCDFETLKLMYR